MKPIIALLLLVNSARADFTDEWIQLVPKLTGPQKVMTIGESEISLRPIAPTKKNDPPTVALFAGEERVTKTPIYPGKRYYFAIVETGKRSQFFVNGQPDAPVKKLELGGATVMPADSDYNSFRPEALSESDIFAHFRKLAHVKDVITVGHRGDNRFSPENTNISYVNAIAKHAPIVEMDLRLTLDNVLILLHDPTVDRTSDGKGAVVEKSLEEAQKLDAGSWKDPKYKGEKIPRVEDIAATCRDKAIMMLDLKCTGLGKSLLELKQKLNFPADQWILAPWEIAEGAALRQYLPDVPMILLHGKIPDEKFDDAFFSHMKQTGFSAFSINWQVITQAFIDAAHKNGMKIYVWTVNDAPDVAGAAMAGADGIITDDVAATMKLCGELAGR